VNKSRTDLHWNERALTERNEAKVNISDTVQRDLELDFILTQLPVGSRTLEVGCGNGYVTQQLRKRVKHIDAFDYSENMIERARSSYGEKNNRFFHGSVLDRTTCEAQTYDVVVCVRVLINLRDLHEQITAIDNMAYWLKPGGKLILIEGFREGFDYLNALRLDCGMPALQPAPINHYSYLDQLRGQIMGLFEIGTEFHTGMFDFLTRVIYPALVGADQLVASGDFHRKIEAVARRYNPQEFNKLARVRGFALVRRV
jgi:ubiquinone/menaquinone biosynthesis C-methylase UbiE